MKDFIKQGIHLNQAKVDTDTGVETVINIPKEYKYMSEVFSTLPDNSFLCKAVGVDQKSKAQKMALKTVKLKHNTFYSFKELKDLVKCAYDKLSVKCTAKATDVQSVYSVKSTSRNGVRGYLIIGKI